MANHRVVNINMIRHTATRRALALVFIGPTFVALACINVTLALLRTTQESGRLFRTGWRGRRMSRDEYSKGLVEFS